MSNQPSNYHLPRHGHVDRCGTQDVIHKVRGAHLCRAQCARAAIAYQLDCDSSPSAAHFVVLESILME